MQAAIERGERIHRIGPGRVAELQQWLMKSSKQENAAMLDMDLYAGFDKSAPALSTPIEPGILPVCEVLNAIPGIQTLWSCEGHPERQSPPYVTFIAPQEIAFQVDQLLSPGRGNETLKYC